MPINRFGELVKVGTERVEEPQGGAQADVALLGLKPAGRCCSCQPLGPREPIGRQWSSLVMAASESVTKPSLLCVILAARRWYEGLCGRI